MTEVLERYISKGVDVGRVEGRAEGRAEGEASGRAEGARVLMERLGMTAQQALDAMGMPGRGGVGESRHPEAVSFEGDGRLRGSNGDGRLPEPGCVHAA